MGSVLPIAQSLVVFAVAASLVGCANAQLKTSADPESGLRQWVLTEAPFELELIQRLPDQTRGFFEARGFTAEQAELVATACVFQTIGRNLGYADGSPMLVIDLHQWRIIRDGQSTAIPSMADWEQQWASTKVQASARIAFRWATFPMQQTYALDDYNWGMVIFGPEPGASFELEVRWSVDGNQHLARIPGITCAPDVEKL